jgi:hypothetical protein
MIELAFFLLVQTVINLLVKRLINTHWQYFFRSLSILFFGVLILIYLFLW